MSEKNQKKQTNKKTENIKACEQGIVLFIYFFKL